MKVMEDLYEILEDELKKIAKKADISPTELENAYKAVDIMKDIETIKAMKGAEAGSEYSQQNSRGSYNSYVGNMSNRGSYGPVWNQDMMPYSMAMNSRGSYDGQSNRGSYEGGMSNRGSYNSYDGRAGRDADSDGRYSEDNSYDNYSNARGRDARGRFTSRDQSYEYSRHSEKERVIDKLETMADVSSDPKTKKAIEQCINKLEMAL